MSNKFLVLGLLVAILIVPILALGVLILATQEGRTAPPAITGLIATDASYARHGQIDLVWSPSDAEDFAYYSVYASETEITAVTKLFPVGQINDRIDVTYQVTKYRVLKASLALVGDTEYWFSVTAVDLSGNESKVGTSVSATIGIMPPLPPTPTPTPAVEIVVTTYLSFSPATVTVSVGGTVNWTQAGPPGYEVHTVTSDTGLFNSGELGFGGTFSYTFTQTGVFGYYCTRHPSMAGTVIVE